MGAIAKIEKITFPTTLNPGELITGSIIIKNVGDAPTSEEAGLLAVLVKTLWDGKEYTLITYSTTAPGQTIRFDYLAPAPHGMIMPEGDAEFMVVGQVWLGWNGGYRADDVKTWIIAVPVIPLPLKPNLLIPLLEIGGLYLIFIQSRNSYAS